MWIRVEGSRTMWINIFLVFGLFQGSFDLFNAYLIEFGLFLPKIEEKNKLNIYNNYK